MFIKCLDIVGAQYVIGGCFLKSSGYRLMLLDLVLFRVSSSKISVLLHILHYFIWKLLL